MKMSWSIAALLVSAPVWASPQYYKCLVETRDGPQIIEVVSEQTDLTVLGKSLLGSKIYLADGVTQISVNNVRECVEQAGSFSSPAAIELESKSPM